MHMPPSCKYATACICSHGGMHLQVGLSRLGPRRSSGNPTAAPSPWETLSAQDPILPARGSHLQHQPVFPAPASARTGHPGSQEGPGRSRPHSASSHSSSHSGHSSSHDHQGTSHTYHIHRAHHAADVRYTHGEDDTASQQHLGKASHAANVQQHDDWPDAYADSVGNTVAGNQAYSFKAQAASDLSPRAHTGRSQNGIQSNGAAATTEAQQSAGQLEQHAGFASEEAKHGSENGAPPHVRGPEGLPVMDQGVNWEGSSAPRSGALRQQGDHSSSPYHPHLTFPPHLPGCGKTQHSNTEQGQLS